MLQNLKGEVVFISKNLDCSDGIPHPSGFYSCGQAAVRHLCVTKETTLCRI